MLATTWQRQTYKYGERGFRYALLDAGHVLAALEFAGHRVGLRLVQSSCSPEKVLSGFGERVDAGQYFLYYFYVVGDHAFEEVSGLDAKCGCGPSGSVTVSAGEVQGSSTEAEPWSNDNTTSAVGRTSPEDLHANGASPPPPTVLSEDFYLSNFVVYDSIRELIVAMEREDRRAVLGSTSPPRREKLLRFEVDRFAPEFRRLPADRREEVFGRLTHERRTATGFFPDAPPLSAQHFHLFLRVLKNPARDVLFFVHNVVGYQPGIYLLGRAAVPVGVPDTEKAPDAVPDSNPFFGFSGSDSVDGGRTPLITETDYHALQRQPPRTFTLVHATEPEQVRILGQNAACGQEIGGFGHFTIAIMGDVGTTGGYDQEHVEAGRLGHWIYLAAEYLRIVASDASLQQELDVEDSAVETGRELRTSGIGCFVDEYFEEILGRELIHDGGRAPLYMMAVGAPKEVK